jgi:hypothetical protein
MKNLSGSQNADKKSIEAAGPERCERNDTVEYGLHSRELKIGMGEGIQRSSSLQSSLNRLVHWSAQVKDDQELASATDIVGK